MPSAAYREAFYAAETDDDTLTLVLLEHPALTEPVRVVHGFENVVSNGLTFSAAAFRAQLPEQNETMTPRLQLVVENIDPEMVTAIRQAVGAPKITVMEVLKSDPDSVEDIYPEFDVMEVEADAAQISLECGYPDLELMQFGAVFTLSQWSGL